MRGILKPASETDAHSVQMDARSFPRAADEEQFGQQVVMASPRGVIGNRLTIITERGQPAHREMWHPPHLKDGR